MADKLCVVMPVYNEQDAIGGVLEKWHAALESLGIDFEIRPYNDGSRDASLDVMRKCAQKLGCRVSVRDKPNGGHGNTVLTGYREAATDGFDWVFQIDSDDEMGPEKFGELWGRRNDFDFLVGIRDGRRQALPRKVVSFVSRLCVRVFYGRSVWDVNTPYRLMRVSAFKDFFSQIPPTTFAPNVILSGLAARARLRCFETRVPQHDRTTGEVSIKKWKLLKAAMKSFWQTMLFSFRRDEGTLYSLMCFCTSVFGVAFFAYVAWTPWSAVFALPVIALVWALNRLNSSGNIKNLVDFAEAHQTGILIGILLAAIALRVATVLAIPSVSSNWLGANPHGGDPESFYKGIERFLRDETFPVTKSWGLTIIYGTTARLFGNTCWNMFAVSFFIQAITGVFAFLIGRKLFSAGVGLSFAFLMLFNPTSYWFSVTFLSETCFMLFAMAALHSFVSAFMEAQTIKALLLVLIGAVLSWFAVWTRAEGILLFASTAVLGVVFLMTKVVTLRRFLALMLPLLLVFVAGAMTARQINNRINGIETIYASTDNLWPRLHGLTMESNGWISDKNVQIVKENFWKDHPDVKNPRYLEDLRPYVEAEIAHRMSSFTVYDWWKLIVRKYESVWHHGGALRLLLQSVFALLMLIGFARLLFGRIKLKTPAFWLIVIHMAAYLGMFCLTEANSIYTYPFWFIWPLFLSLPFVQSFHRSNSHIGAR